MKSVASAPGKVILFGEHFVVHGVKAILCTIDKRITATSQLLDERKIRIKSRLGNAELNLDMSSNLDSISPKFMRPFLHIAKETLREFNENRGVEIILESDIPAGIGLGSSSAACVATTASVAGLFGRKSKEDILKRAIESERIIFEDVSGADSSVSVFGGLITYSKDGIEKIDSKNDLSLIIANSNQIHSTREVVLKVKEFKNKNEKLFAEMCEQENAIIKNVLSAIKEDNLTSLGFLMSKNQEMLEKINVSTDRLDLLIREASKTSYGAKITGAGGGGCIISLVDESNAATTLENLRKISDCFISKIDFEGLSYSQ
ncbi:MAG: mevalonate kinase [Thaumarchaeota archaeon]|nr:mevalonate kinase [Nitrososphaerota archaeon]